MTRPGSLNRVPVVAVGGWFPSADHGLPDWGPEMDWNVQWDTTAARVVAGAADLTLVPLPVTLKAHLRTADLPRLRASGPLGRLLAAQGEAHGQDWNMPTMGRAHAGLPHDLLTVQYDAVDRSLHVFGLVDANGGVVSRSVAAIQLGRGYRTYLRVDLQRREGLPMLEQLHKSGLRAERLYLAGIASVGAVFADWLGSKRLEHAGVERVDVSPQLFWCGKCPRELLC